MTGAEHPRVWVVSELYHPEETSTGHVMTGIAEALATRHEVRVLCGRPTYSSRGLEAPRRERRQGVLIDRPRASAWSNRGWVGRLVNLASMSLSFSLFLARRVRPGDVVLVVTNPPSLPIVIGWACRWRGARCVVLVHDLYPDLLAVAGQLRPGSIFFRFLDRLASRSLKAADRVVVIGRCMAGRVREKLAGAGEPGRADRVRVITNWADLEQVEARPREGCPLLCELGLEDKVVIQCAGNLGPLSDLGNVVDAIEACRSCSRLHFLFAGRGRRQEWLEREAARRGLDNVTLLGWRPRAEASRLHRACDAVLIPLRPGMAGISVPSRLYNTLASGRPVLAVAEEDSELARVVSEEEVGWVARPGDPEALAELLRVVAGNRDERQRRGRQAREVAERRYGRSAVLGQWLELVRGLGSGWS